MARKRKFKVMVGTVLATGILAAGVTTTHAKTKLNPNDYLLAPLDNESFAITETGKMYYWGNNTHTPQHKAQIPTRLQINKIKGQASAESYKIALTNDGRVTAWGSNQWGGLGPNIPRNWVDQSQEFHIIQGLQDVASIDARSGASIAVKKDGTVWGWGRNTSSKLLVQDDTAYQTNQPIQLNLTNMVAVELGHYFGVGLNKNGELYIWGTKRIFPNSPITEAKIDGISDVKAFAVGREHIAYVTDNGQVYTLGKNYDGQLGLGFSENIIKKTPQRIEGLTDVVNVVAEYSHTLALKKDGTVWGWGRNSHNALGNGPEEILTPTQIEGLTDIIAISTSDKHSLALKADGSVYTWGYTKLADKQVSPYKIPGFNLFDGKGSVRVMIDDVLFFFNQPAIVKDGATLVPLRGIFEALGANVKYDATKSLVLASRGSNEISLTIGSKNAFQNGKPKTLTTPAQVVNGSTLVPLRFISEALGAQVEFDSQYGIVKIYQ